MVKFLFQAFITFYKYKADVTGPTPPGTGVINLAFFWTFSKSTSPTILVLSPSIGSFAPTSITIAPSLTDSSLIKCLLPAADIKMSASLI